MTQHNNSPSTTDDATTPQADLGISFAGGGWLMCYLFGVAKALRAHHLHHTARFTGTSAGSLAAIGLTLNADFDAITHTVVSSYVPQAHGSLAGPFQMREYLVDALTRHANLHDYKRCNADPLKCTVVYTSLSAWAPRRKSTFSSASHLLETLIASCCATPLVGLPFQLEGEWVIDGGLLENQPKFQPYHHVSRVVNVSPNVLDRDADIRPSQYVPPWWSMYPPSPEELSWVYALGQKDGHDWCIREGLAVPGETAMETPQRPIVQHTAVGQFLGHQQVETKLQSAAGRFALRGDFQSAIALLQLELFAWMVFQACTSTLDSSLLLWMLAVGSTLLTTAHDDASAQLIRLGIVVYVALCGFQISHTFQRLHDSDEWTQLELAVESLRNLTPSGDLLELSQHSQSLSKDQHAALADHSLLYRVTSAHVRPQASVKAEARCLRRVDTLLD